MPVDQAFVAKMTIIDNLQDVRNSAEDAESVLRLADKGGEADTVHARITNLNLQLDTLLGALMAQWGADAADPAGPVAQLACINSQLSASEVSIKAGIDVVNQVVSVLGALDQALVVAAKIVSTL